MPSAGRALALALALLLLPPLATAQEPEVPDPDPSTPSQLDCQLEDCLPDLIPSNPYAEASDDRSPVTACTDFVNIGTGPTANPFRILLSIDGVEVAEHQAQGVYQQGGGETGVCWEGIMLARGRHTMSIRVDHLNEVIESDEGNNVRSAVFFVGAPPQVDLVVMDFDVTPREAGPGQTQTFIVNVTNRGAIASSATVVELTDPTGVLAEWPLPALSPSQTKTLVLPTYADVRPVGSFVARVIVDPGANVSEQNEGNNEAFLEFTVLDHPAPDYRITNVTVSGNHTAMRGVRIDVFVTNVGDRAVRGTVVRVLNETNTTLTTGVTRNIINPGTAAVVQFYATLPAGQHKLRLVADPRNLVPERNETNNEWLLELTILEASIDVALPNLIVERLYAMPEDPRPGEPVSVGALVHNVGTNVSTKTSINFSVNGRQVGTAEIPPLKPDAFYSAYIPWVGGNASLYTIRALVDPGDTVFEYEDGDNALEREFLISTQRPPAAEPPAPTPTTPTPTTPTGPTGPTPTTPTGPATPPAPSNERVAVGDIILSTREVPGGVKGFMSVSVRNPNIEPVGQLTVEFKVDGERVAQRLVAGIRGAGTIAVSSGEVDLPPGEHTITAELRVVGATDAPLVRERSYEAEAGKKGLPGFEAVALLAAVAVALVVRRRR